MNFVFKGLAKDSFSHLFDADEGKLNEHLSSWKVVDQSPGYPCRISLVDARVGERVLLTHFNYHNVNSAYKASGPIFIRENAENAQFGINEIPPMLLHRTLSIRAYDKLGDMINAKVIEGHDLSNAIQQLFKYVTVNYLHVHNAGPGCYSCCVQRAI